MPWVTFAFFVIAWALTDKLTAILVLIQTLVFIFGLPISHKVQNRPFASARTVFGEYTNFSDWGLGVSVPYSWFCTLWVNSAWMVPVYVAEETHDASREIPKSLWYTFSVTAVIGMVICLVSAFCINDIEAAAADERHVFEDSLKGVHANPL